ncbi:MAG: hypothetical protein MRQ13_05015 [Candidatus Midichloria sp.]|nr:hypothetical protein [Candidatus Midichloria sp.]
MLLGNGDGTLLEALFPYDAGANPAGTTAIDLNNDGKLDTVNTNGGSNAISVLVRQRQLNF